MSDDGMDMAGLTGMGDNMGIEAMSDGSFSDDGDYGGGGYGETLPEGVTKEVLTAAASDKWKRPAKGDEVTVHYVGTLEDGTEFDSSVKKGTPLVFNLGKGEVIEGWDAAVASMKELEKSKFTIAPELAYGEEGQPPVIPPNATLNFEIELLSWRDRSELTEDGGIVRIELQKGTWKSAKLGSEVELTAVCSLADGNVVGRHERFVYVVGGDQPLGLADATVEKFVTGMNKGQTVEVTLAPAYGFGDLGGLGGKVPAGATLKLEVTLHQIYEVEECGLFHDKGQPSVSKKCVQEGEGYDMPKDFASVTVTVQAESLDGAALGSLETTFTLSTGEHCEALEAGLLKMKPAETAVVTCADPALCADPKLGVSGQGARFTVTLSAFGGAKNTWDMSNGEKVTHGEKLKTQAAAFFKQSLNRRALALWKQCLDLFSYTDKWEPEEKKAGQEMTKACKLNSAQAWLNLAAYAEAEKLCDEILKDESCNVKALYRRGLARAGKKDYERATYDLKKVLELDASNAAAKRELAKVNQEIKKDEKRQAGLFKNMLSGLGKGPIPPPGKDADKLPLNEADDDGLSDDGLDAEPADA